MAAGSWCHLQHQAPRGAWYHGAAAAPPCAPGWAQGTSRPAALRGSPPPRVRSLPVSRLGLFLDGFSPFVPVPVLFFHRSSSPPSPRSPPTRCIYSRRCGPRPRCPPRTAPAPHMVPPSEASAAPRRPWTCPSAEQKLFTAAKPLQKKVLSAANAPRPCASPCAPHKTAGFQPRAAQQGLCVPPPSSRGGAGTGTGRCARRLSTQPCWCPGARTVPTLPTAAMRALCGGSPEPLATSPTPGGPCAFPVGLWPPGERLPPPQALNQGGRHPVTGTALPVPSLPSTRLATARSPAVRTGTARAHVSPCHRSWGQSHHFHGSCCIRGPKSGAPQGPAAAWAPPPLRHHPAALP